MSVIPEMPATTCHTTIQETALFIREHMIMKQLLSWLEDITPAERRQVRKYLNNFKDSGKELCNDLICLVMQSVANLCIVPMQDYLGLDNSARMNQPSTLGKNWKWRLKEGQFMAELQKEMLELATRYGRR